MRSQVEGKQVGGGVEAGIHGFFTEIHICNHYIYIESVYILLFLHNENGEAVRTRASPFIFDL